MINKRNRPGNRVRLLGAVPIGVFAVAWLFAGPMGEMEILRLFVIGVCASSLAVAGVGGVIAAAQTRALTAAEQALMRADEAQP